MNSMPAYAADGYARLRGIGAVVTTYGVGELSAVNAIAGSYAEYVPVVHIVGVPAKDIQANHRIIHHTLGDGDFHHFRRIAAEVTCAQADLGAADACQEIDRVLNSVLVHRRPGYLMLATDTARMAVDPPTARLSPPADFSSDGARAAFAVAAREFLAERRVTILADIFVNRIGATDQLRGLLASGDLPYATLAWGKTLVDESTPNFLGVYTGAASPESVRAAVEDAERLVTVGVQYTDSITAGFSHRIDPRRTIDIGPERTVIGGVDAFAPLSLTAALEVLTDLTEEFADPDKTMPTADVIPMVTDANETPSPRPRSGRSSPEPSTTTMWLSRTRVRPSSAWRPCACRPASPSWASRSGAPSATPCPPRWARAWPVRIAAPCW